MNGLVETLAPAFVVSLAIQQLLELIDPLLEHWLKPQKALWMSCLALGVSLLLTMALHFRLLLSLGVQTAGLLDALVSALFLTAGTSGINDLLKIVDYRKQTLHARAGDAGRMTSD